MIIITVVPAAGAEDRRVSALDPSRPIVGGLLLLAVVGGAILAATAPVVPLLGGGHAVRGIVHGLAAGLLMVTVTVGLYQAWRLWGGGRPRVEDLKAGSLAYVLAALATTVSGNWIYIPYRASGPDSPRSFFMATSPEVHKVWFEFKEFGALFVLPLAVAAAYIIWSYGEDLIEHRGLRRLVAVTLLLGFFYFAVAFGLGAAVTKLRAV